MFQVPIYFILVAKNQEHLDSHNEEVANDISKKIPNYNIYHI